MEFHNLFRRKWCTLFAIMQIIFVTILYFYLYDSSSVVNVLRSKISVFRYGTVMYKPVSSSSTEESVSRVLIDQIPSDVSTDQIPSDVSTDQIPSAASTDQIPSSVSTDQIPSGVSTDQIPSAASTDQIPSGVSTDQIPSGVSTDQIPSGVSTPTLYPDRKYDVNCRDGVDKLRHIPLTSVEAKRVLQWYESVDDYFSPSRTDPINMPEDDGENMFRNYDHSKPSTHELRDPTDDYFVVVGMNAICYKRGIVDSNNKTHENGCVCGPDFTGVHCSVPISVKNSVKKKNKYSFRARKVPRRIISAMTFNNEHVVLYLKLLQTAPAVDLFVLLEGNVTNYGDPKPLYLLPALKRGFLRRWHSKIMYMFNSKFLSVAKIRNRGFEQETYIRGLFGPAMKNRITNLRDDDLFMYFDADEAPGLDELLFLKLHDGYPVPVGFHMQLFHYGLYWHDFTVPWTAVGVCPMKMFYDVYSGQAHYLRGHANNFAGKGIKNFGHHPLHDVWLIGSKRNCTGWHLSYFGTPRQVYTKLVSAVNADFPRWGDDPMCRNISYIATLFRRGIYFDLKHEYLAMCPQNNPQFKYLNYIFKYPNYFNYLLVNPTIFIPP